MGPSDTLVAPGLRTPVRPGWRAGVATALAVVAAQPGLWMLGALGFLLRGGIVLLTLAILVVPSPVAVRLMLGEYLGSFGLTPEFFALGAVAAGALVVVAVLALLVLAAVEMAAFERFLAPYASAAGAVPPAGPAEQRRLRAVGGVFAVQLVALLAVAAGAAPLIWVAGHATYAELLRPNLAGGALYDRVIAQLGDVVFILLAVLVLVEMVSAVATRRLLLRIYGLGHASGNPIRAIGAGLVSPLLRPLSTLPSALLGWLVTVGLLAPAAWVIGQAWHVARNQLLALPAGLEAAAGPVVATLLLVTIWLGGLAAAGLASALRAALWTSEALR